MNITLLLSSEEDMEQFKTLFFRNVGVERIVFDLYANCLIVRIQIAGYGDSQAITIGLFSRMVEGKTTTISQFNPLLIEELRYTTEIQKIWGTDTQEAWAHLFHREEDAEAVFTNIMELCNLIKSVG